MAQGDQIRILAGPTAENAESMFQATAGTDPETLRGKTTHFTVYYTDSLGNNGATLADAVLASCEQNYTRLQSLFGGITPAGLPFIVHIQPGSHGASHNGCGATEMFCGAFDGTDGVLENMLVVAEADEVFMNAQNAGWNCGYSNGEGLSRVLAYELTGKNFATAASWLKSDRADWIDQTDTSDTNSASTGCSTLFLNYLRYQLGFSWEKIIAAGGSTLATTYQKLIDQNDAYVKFTSLVSTHYPSGSGSNLTTDNIFPLSSWRRKDLSGTVGAPLASSSPFGFVLDSDPNGSSLHTVYLGNDLHIHELYFLTREGKWHDNDLTNATGAPLASSGPTGFVWRQDPNSSSMHVIYQGNDLCIHELWFTVQERAWHDNNLTRSTGAPLASSGPTGFVWDRDPNSSSMHVVYQGNDLCIHELWHTAAEGQWHDNNLTRSTGGPLVNTGAYGYVWDNDPNSSSMHVVYQGNDLCIHELWHTAAEGQWHDNNLTRSTGGPLVTSGACGYVWDRDPHSSSMHVVYRGNDLHIHELWHTAAEGQWHDNSLTSVTGGPLASSGPAGYVWDHDPNSSSMHVVYQGNDLHVHELWYTAAGAQWHDNDLTDATGGSLLNSGPVGYVWEQDGQRIVYQGNDLHIYELWDPRWG